MSGKKNANGNKAEAYDRLLNLNSYINNPLASGVNLTSNLSNKAQGTIVIGMWLIFAMQILMVIDSAISGGATYNIYGAITSNYQFSSKFISASIEIIFTLFLFYTCYVNQVSWMINKIKSKHDII